VIATYLDLLAPTPVVEETWPEEVRA